MMAEQDGSKHYLRNWHAQNKASQQLLDRLL